MSRTGWRFSLSIYREDGSAVGQAPITVDFEPAREWARFACMRRNELSPDEICAPTEVVPLWHPGAGEPYLRGFRIAISPAKGESIGTDFTTHYFRKLARAASAAFVEKGSLASGETFRYLATAFRDRTAPSDAPRFVTEETPPDWELRSSGLGGFRERSTPTGPFDPRDVPVFLPRRVLDEATELTRGSGGSETGGILLGHLHRDPDVPEVFVEVTAQVPAEHARADSRSLEFTPRTWTAIRSVMDRRGRAELMVGWWHSHPVRHWCRNCPPGRQRRCHLAKDFLSDHDRHLHRTVFPRAYSVALVMNDVSFSDVTHSLFGWKEGRLETRGYELVAPTDTRSALPASAKGGPDGP